ncbi:GTP 3',8-cyclase MoaA [Chryseobacterium sp. Leaf180]|uniref:GTP 3',8-cyclase MoaA n=1 Tax=Chryseobacterium sp. Leaf180 TaxID=1736289 RepID=UPI000A63C193|nr:GTP 3',8-cyclase MoaA [Chryseobacterium sp. Leaf180]
MFIFVIYHQKIMLTDKFGRKINYLRLAVIDRCNLRCNYCMPAEGLVWTKQPDLMLDDEIIRLSEIFTDLGVDKIRITGGEPFVRKNMINLLERLSANEKLKQLNITTNGLLTQNHIPAMKKMGVKTVNLSLDTLDAERFYKITRRNSFDLVMKTLYDLIENNFRVKINAVVMGDQNISDIIPLAELTKILPVEMRFIEEMPFNGNVDKTVNLKWNHSEILKYIKSHFPDINQLSLAANSTSVNYKIPGYLGEIGIIAAYTRSFCGDCNRLRVTPTGILKTCLYEGGGVDLKQALRDGMSDEEVKKIIIQAVSGKSENGWEAEKLTLTKPELHQSMATIGG